jgi:hypothetical protein
MTRTAFPASEQLFMRELRAVGDVGVATLSDVLRAHARSTRTTLQKSRPLTSPHRFSQVPRREGSKILRPRSRSGTSDVLNPNHSLTPTTAAISGALPGADGRFGLPQLQTPDAPITPVSALLNAFAGW